MDVLYVNPKAGPGRDSEFWTEQLRKYDVASDPMVINEPKQVKRLDPDDRLMVAGGDGTLTLLTPLCMETGCVMAVLPSGTGNDFARGLGIPLDPEGACELLKNGKVKQIDVGLFEKQPFLNVAHVGLGSKISRKTDGSDKKSWGRFSYLKRLIEHLREERGFRARLDLDGKVFRGRWLEIAIANGRSFGGGHQIEGASPEDGKLTIVGVRPHSFTQLLINGLKLKVLRRKPSPSVLLHMTVRECDISRCAAKTVVADGEVQGQVPNRFSVHQGALRVLVSDQ